MGSTSTAVAEKTAEELRKEIDELKRQQWEITERLRDPRGLRRAAAGAANGPRPNLARPRGVVRPVTAVAMETEDEPPPKRRLSSTVVKVGGGDAKEEALVEGGVEDKAMMDRAEGAAETAMNGEEAERKPGLGLLRDRRITRINYDVPLPEPTPRVLPKDEDPSLVKRNRRMLGQLIGTLQKFQDEDKQLSSSEAFLRRSDSMRKAEQRAREESERLRKKEREQIMDNRRRDLTLRARVIAKAEEKKLELLFLQWADHQKKLCNFLRTKARPPIYYVPKVIDDSVAVTEQKKEQAFLEWKSARRAELSQYQKQTEERLLTNVEMQLERMQNARNARRANNLANLQESMDKELETHQLEHGPKTRRIPGGNEEEEDVDDIAVAEDDIMDDVLGVDEGRGAEADSLILEPGNDDRSPKDVDAQ